MPVMAMILGIATACAAPARPAETAVLASGTDLESGNPLVTVHPLTRQVQRHALFVTLVRLDSTLEPVPYLARSWTWNAAHDALTFSLHDDLRWHDGVPTTAADVAFTFTSVRNPSLGAPRAGDLASVTSVEATNDTTFIMQFSTAQQKMPIVLAELPIVPRHLLDTVSLARWRAGAFALRPVGNGPFRFAERVAGRRWRFVRNEQFPTSMGGPPPLAQFVVAVVDEAATKFAGLVSGELDMAGVSPSMAKLVLRDSTLTLLTPPSLFTTLIAFNTTRPPFDDVRVRRALSLSLDRQRIVDAAVAGYATPAGGAIPMGLAVSEAKPPIFSPARADSLLDAAGWKRNAAGERMRDGTRLRLRLITVGSGDMAAEQLMQSDLRARGVAVDVQVRELATFLTTVRATTKDFDAAYTGVSGDLALGQLIAMFSTSQRGGALDYTGFHRPSLDTLLSRARIAPPGTAATLAWRAVDSLLTTESPVAFIYHARGVQGLSRRLQHVTMDLRGELTSIASWTRRDRASDERR
jgi:peptide/nickel transport system substrate-binding protein